MTTTALPRQAFGDMAETVILLEHATTTPVCEGMNRLLASFQALYLQYQKHHFVVEGAEFYQLHQFFQDCYEQVQGHVHDLGERLNGLGAVPVAGFQQLAAFCCFNPEPEGAYGCRDMLNHDLAAEQAVIQVLRQQATQAESLGDRATAYLYDQILLNTEERAYHIAHFLANDSLKA